MTVVAFPVLRGLVFRRSRIRDNGQVVTEFDMWFGLGDFCRHWGTKPVWSSVEAVS